MTVEPDYVDGYSGREAERPVDQASALTELRRPVLGLIARRRLDNARAGREHRTRRRRDGAAGRPER